MSNGTNSEYNYLFKLVMIGDAKSGKSSILKSYVQNSFEDRYILTIGVDFFVHLIEVDGTRCKLQLWDTAGEERFRPITSSYYRGGTGFFVVYDITDERSFENVTMWLQEMERYTSPGKPTILIGNKLDLDNQRQVSRERGQALADQHNMAFFECSAKDKTNLTAVFEAMTRLRLTIAREESERNASTLPLPAPVPTNPLEEVIDYGFTDFNVDQFLRDNFEQPMTKFQDTFEKLAEENKKLQAQVAGLKDLYKTVTCELKELKKQETNPLPLDITELRQQLQIARKEEHALNQTICRLQATPETLSSFGQLEDFKALKAELQECLERVEVAQIEYKQRQSSLCVVCYVKEKNMVLTGCGHMCLCEDCANVPSLSKCPICRKTSQGKLKIFV